jgi:hypothetical protein
MLTEDQISLFEVEGGTEPQISFLHVVKDLRPTRMEINEIFDKNLFDEMKAVTFVASPKFFFKTTKEFNKIQLILGIEDQKFSSDFINGLDLLLIEKRVEFWNELDEQTKDQLRSKQYSVRYTQKGYAVHSKFYLLKGNNHTRLLVGSANFTETAFVKQKQFEELLIFDNNELFEIYERRFNDILEYTSDYIPERLKSYASNQPVYVSDADYLKQLLLDEVNNKRIKFALTEEEINEIKLLPEKVQVQNELALTAKNLVEVITKRDKKTGIYTLLPPAQIRAKSVAIKTILSRTSKKSQQLDTRSELYYSDKNQMIYTNLKNEQIDSLAKESELVLFSQRIESIEKLKQNLELIVAFIEAYRLYTTHEDIKCQSKIFEIILYSFMSTYIWKMRDHYHLEEGRRSVRRHFPPFLFIAGRPFSGKTTVLELIGLLIGNNPPYLAYESIKTSKVLLDYFNSSNINPLLVDEIDLKFFTSTAEDKGERLIKHISNDREGEHPCLIGTTNATGFDMNHQAAMRIYYLQIDNTFDNNRNTDSSI